MPGKKYVRGVGPKEQLLFYGKRAEEIAARTVLKHHKEEGHDTGE